MHNSTDKQKYAALHHTRFLYPIEPDHDLILWEKWAKVRRDETICLGKRTMRPPADLTMNLVEKVREDKEWKTAVQHAQISKKATLRGSLWEQAQRLKQRCYCEPVYEIKRTAAELGHARVIEHIGCPNYIQETEKGVIGEPTRAPCVKLDAEYKRYRLRREIELKDKIEKIDPFRPDIRDLLVIGRQPKAPPKKMPPLPKIIVTSPESSLEVHSVYALRINNTLIYKSIPDQTLPYLDKLQKEPWHEFCYSWTYYFNCPVNRVGKAKLFLENLGTVTLRYCWKKNKRLIPFIPEDIYEQKYFFCKNEDVICPGQRKELILTFISGTAGIYSESWELSLCNICLFDSLTEKLVINLTADSVENHKSVTRKIERLDKRINRKALCRVARDLINEIITRAFSVELKIYPYKKLFLEAEIFIMKNPICFYHQTEVSKLNKMYTENIVPGEVWDLSLCMWRKKMMDKEFEERMTCYDILKKSHGILLKPWHEGDDLLHQKYRAVKLLLGQLFDKFYDEYQKISDLNGAIRPIKDSISDSLLICTHLTSDIVRHLFYLHMNEHLGMTIELCVGVITSLELNRWIEFDFCQW